MIINLNAELGCRVWEPTVVCCSCCPEIVEGERQEADVECGANEITNIKATLALGFQGEKENFLSFPSQT